MSADLEASRNLERITPRRENRFRQNLINGLRAIPDLIGILGVGALTIGAATGKIPVSNAEVGLAFAGGLPGFLGGMIAGSYSWGDNVIETYAVRGAVYTGLLTMGAEIALNLIK
ncbi:MAG: hypothetical protein WCP97_08865 [bacterium]